MENICASSKLEKRFLAAFKWKLSFFSMCYAGKVLSYECEESVLKVRKGEFFNLVSQTGKVVTEVSFHSFSVSVAV